MAYIDLNSADAQSIRNQYRTSLGRDASDDEVSGWLSGAYGGGDLNARLNQIATSHEAQQRQPAPTLGQQPGVSTTQTPGMGSPESGYGPGGVTNPAYTGAGDFGNFSSQIANTYQQALGRAASQDEISNWWSGAYGYGQGMSGLQSMLSAIQNSGEARARGYQPGTTGTTGTGAGGTGTGGAGSAPGGGPRTNTFNDVMPWFQSLTQGKAPTYESLKAMEPILNQYGIRLGSTGNRGWTDAIILPDGTIIDTITNAGAPNAAWSFFIPTGSVGGGAAPGNQYSDPYTQFLEMLIKSRIGNLQGGYDDAARQQYQAALQARAQSLATGNAQLTQLMDYLQKRFTDLQGPGYTGAENEVLRTQALDPMERDRSAARQRLTERLAAMGHTPESGVFQQAMLQLDNEFDAMRGVTQTQLATNELGRRENRAQRAEAIGAQLADIPELRAREQLDVFQALNNLATVARQEDEARAREAITYGGVLSDLGPQRMQLAMQAAGMGGNPSALGSVLSNLMGVNQNASMLNQQNSNSMWSALGSMAAIIARSGQSGLSNVGI